jgi:serine/threonine-protein kinase RsbW
MHDNLKRRARTLELHIPSELGWERPAMDLAASVADRMGFPADRVEDIRTAVGEAVTNAIEHGSRPDGPNRVEIVLAPEAAALAIEVHDTATTPFPPEVKDGTPPSLEDRLARRAPARGWGTFLIRNLVDEVEFSSDDQGNQVRMVIFLRSS